VMATKGSWHQDPPHTPPHFDQNHTSHQLVLEN
jgi:hypothetical protein